MSEIQALNPLPRKHGWVIALVFLFILLFYISRTNYLLFHSLAELFSIVVATSIFVMAWNTRRFLDYGYLLFIGIAYLFIAGIDLLHTLAYRGMGVFPAADANLPTQLWLAARYMQAVSLVFAPVFLHRRGNPWRIFLGYLAATTLISLSVFVWQNFPDSFIEGSGLTPFKRISEYIISSILVISAGLLYINRRSFAPAVLRLLLLSILTSILSELAFTVYIDVTDILNALGHFLKILAFSFIYLAIVETGFVRPYDLLFRDLKQSEQALRKTHDELELRVQERTAEVLSTNLALQAEIEKHEQAEAELRKIRAHLEELVQARTAELEREILERKRAEAAVTRYAARLERSNRDLDDFASAVSHDLQEPLRKVQAFSGQLRKHIPTDQHSPETENLIDRIQDAVQRMSTMIDDLLAYARVNTETRPYQPTDLNQVVAEAIGVLELRIAETAGRVEVDPLPTLDADHLQMRLLFQNLIGNALKFHKPGQAPLVSISTREPLPTSPVETGSPAGTAVGSGEGYDRHDPAGGNGDRDGGHEQEQNLAGPEMVEIVIADNGIGFDEKYAGKLFNPFQRLVGRSEYEGTGIGLAICRKITERHGGQITAHSRPGEGTRFIIRLPLTQPEAPSGSASSETAALTSFNP